MSGGLTFDRQLAGALVDCARSGKSGIVTASRGKLRRLFCVEQGALVHAVSNLIEEQLEERLVAAGALKLEALVQTRTAAQGGGTKLSRALLESGALGESELRSALERHARELLFATLDWSSGEASFARGTPDLAGEVQIRLDCPALLREYAREHPRSLDETRMRIGSPSSRPVRSEGAERLLKGFEPDPVGKFVLQASDGSRSIAGLLELSPEPPETTLRALYGLLLSGVLVPDTRARAAEARGAVTREEVLARLERVEGADYYTVLEVGPMASASEIRETYYFLARRYHPDRFRSGTLQDLRERIETFFAQVTEAYNNLSDPALRAQYDAARAAAPTTKTTPEQDRSYLARQNFAHAKLLMERGRNTDAVTSLENAIQLDASQAAYHLELGRLLAANPRLRARAEECLLRATQIDPAMADAYVALGQLSTRKGRREDAMRHFREALRWEPGHLEAQTELQKLENEPGDSSKRRGLFRG